MVVALRFETVFIRKTYFPSSKNSFKATSPPIQAMGLMCGSVIFLGASRMPALWLN
jgi:hypothetical protein